jgi:glycosyltransferase involved in cell wall biosynthesis
LRMRVLNEKPRLAVISPFLDKSHGTERIVTEWVTQLAGKFEIHIYSQRVEDIDLTSVTWHRIPKLAGPHLFSFIWWFAANHIWRAWDRRFRNVGHDIVFSPGINCLDADVVSVHIVFAKFLRDHRTQLSLRESSVRSWPRLLHRKLYYELLTFLEKRVYPRPNVRLIFMSQRTVTDVKQFQGNRRAAHLLYVGIDHTTFNTATRATMREDARRFLGFSEGRFVLLLIGNDWRNKGLPVILEALEQISELTIDLVVVSREDLAAVRAAVAERSLRGHVVFLPPRKDVEFYYAAADAYVGPSQEDTYALPPAEAMACGLPVIVSAEAGVSEIITDGVDGLVLKNPHDANTLSAMIRRLCENREFGARLGRKASETMQQYTWERNGLELAAIFEDILRSKVPRTAYSSSENDHS